MRVIDFSMGWAGPLVPHVLACFGADVIKVEDTLHYDWWRGGHPKDAPRGPDGAIIPTHELAPTFNSVNRGKRGITLDLAQPQGRAVFLKLVAVSDVLVENFTPRVTGRLGIDYATLSVINPALIMLSMPAMGASGPEAGYSGFGMTIEAMAGLTALCGYQDGPPQFMSNAFGDPVSGLNGAVAVLIALIERRRTGRGRQIELSQVEGFLPITAGALLDVQLNGRAAGRTGNHRPGLAPHNVYRCAGDDDQAWFALAVGTDREWQAVCLALARPDLAADARFADVISRHRHQAELDALIAGWAARRDRSSALAALSEAGAPAAPVHSNGGVLDEPAHVLRELFHPVERAYSGIHLYPSLPLLVDGARPLPDRPAPCLGEHNAEVLRSLLGMNEAEVGRLAAEGVIGAAPRELAALPA